MTACNVKYEIIRKYCNHEYSRREAAELLNLSERQISRLKLQYLEGNLLPVSIRETANAKMHQTIIESKSLPAYQNMNISQYKQALKNDFFIDISYSALYNILKEHNIESPLKQNRNMHSPEIRMREASAGALLHVFFIPTESDLFHLFLLDDATGRMLAYRFFSRPNCFSCFALLYNGFCRYGLPDRLRFHLLSQIHTDTFSETMKEAIEMLSITYELSYEESVGYTENLRRNYLIHTLTEYLAEADTTSARFLVEFNKKYAIRASQHASFRSAPNDAALKLALSYHKPWHMNTSGSFSINKRNYIIQHDFLSIPPVGSPVMLHIHNPSVIYAVYRSQLYTACSKQ